MSGQIAQTAKLVSTTPRRGARQDGHARALKRLSARASEARARAVGRIFTGAVVTQRQSLDEFACLRVECLLQWGAVEVRPMIDGRILVACALVLSACGPANGGGGGGGDGGATPSDATPASDSTPARDAMTSGGGRAAQCQRILTRTRACGSASECELNASMGICERSRPEVVDALEACSARGCDAGSCSPPMAAPSPAFTALLRAICTACPAVSGSLSATVDACIASTTAAQILSGIVGLFDDATLTAITPCLSRLPSELTACVSGFQVCIREAVPAYAALEMCSSRP